MTLNPCYLLLSADVLAPREVRRGTMPAWSDEPKR